MLLFLAGDGVQSRYHPVDSGETDHLLDIAVIILFTNERQQSFAGQILIHFQNFYRRRRKRNTDRVGAAFLLSTAARYRAAVYCLLPLILPYYTPLFSFGCYYYLTPLLATILSAMARISLCRS